MKVLIENSSHGDFLAEHGLSVYIEYNSRKYLLDTGSSDAFLENADKMGVRLEDIDAAFLSHGHYDHSGGFSAFFRRNNKALVYMKRQAKEKCYSMHGDELRYIGIPEDLTESYPDRFVLVDGDREIEKGVWLISHHRGDLVRRGEKAHMYRMSGGVRKTDDFAHEQSLVFVKDDGLVLLNSCSHAGIEDIVEEVNEVFSRQNTGTVHTVLGGFHLMGHSGLDSMSVKEEDVIRIGERLMELGVRNIYTGHCTGEPAYRILKEVCKDRMHALTTGLEIYLEEGAGTDEKGDLPK